MAVSSRKKLRSKRRLIQLLLRKIQEGIKIKIDIFNFMKEIQDLSDNSGPEGRLISIMATVEKSYSSWEEEGRHIFKLFKKNQSDLKYSFYDRRGRSALKVFPSKLNFLSSNETKTRGFTHKFQIFIITKLSIKESNTKDMMDDLCRFRGITASTGENLYFQVENG